MDESSGLAGVPGLSQRDRRGSQDAAVCGCGASAATASWCVRDAGRRCSEIAAVYEREVRDLPCFEYRTTVVIELYRVRCPDCGIKAEKVPQLPSKAPFSKRFEEAVGQACESAAARRVARQFGLAASTVRAIDLRYLERWAEGRRRSRRCGRWAWTRSISGRSRSSSRW